MPRRLMLAVLAICLVLEAPVLGQFSFLFDWDKEPADSPTAEEITWVKEPAAALKTAQATSRPILAYVTSDKCGFCRKMNQETWTDPAVAKLVKSSFVPLRLHAGDHPEEVAALGVKAFPTTILITPKGKAFAGKPGFMGPKDLKELVQPALAKAAPKPVR